jgi:twinkle protein
VSVAPDSKIVEAKKRGITYDTMRKYRVSYSEATKQMQFAYIVEGAYYGVKTVDAHKNYRWSGTNPKDRVPLFGMSTAPNRKKELIICEGEWDALAADQMSNKWKVAVSVPFGAQSALKYVKQHLEWVEGFEKVYLCFDMDEPGRKASSEVMALLTPGKAYEVALPEGFKDANDMLKAGKSDEFNAALDTAQPRVQDWFIGGEELVKDTLNYMFNPELRVGIPTGYNELDKIVGGWRQSEVIGIVSGTGVGKSTFVVNLIHNLIEQGQSIIHCPLENQPVLDHLKLAEIKLGVSLRKIPKDVPVESIVSRGKLEQSLTEISLNANFLRGLDSYAIPEFLSKLEYGVRTTGSKFVFIDHITVLAETGDNATETIGKLMAGLRKLATQHKVCVIFVTHQSKSPDDKTDSTTSIHRLKHGSCIGQVADCLLGIERPRDSFITTVRTLKASRTWGEMGEFKLSYQKESGRLQEKTQPNMESDDPRQPTNPAPELPVQHSQEDIEIRLGETDSSPELLDGGLRKTDVRGDDTDNVHPGHSIPEEEPQASTRTKDPRNRDKGKTENRGSAKIQTLHQTASRGANDNDSTKRKSKARKSKQTYNSLGEKIPRNPYDDKPAFWQKDSPLVDPIWHTSRMDEVIKNLPGGGVRGNS